MVVTFCCHKTHQVSTLITDNYRQTDQYILHANTTPAAAAAAPTTTATVSNVTCLALNHCKLQTSMFCVLC